MPGMTSHQSMVTGDANLDASAHRPYTRSMSRSDRQKWETSISRLQDQTGPDDYWLKLTPKERVDLTWELSLEAWQLAHPDYEDEPGLPRSVARVVRRES